MKGKLKSLMNKLKGAAPSSQSEPEPAPQRVLFVCMGNICRSPTAEGVLRKLVAESTPALAVEVDSAGTHAYHVGEPPDPRAQRAAARRGVEIGRGRARRVLAEDFERFDWLLAMDQTNYELLHEMSPVEQRSRIRLFLEFAPQLGRSDVPDPYYGGANGFEHVLDLVEEAAAGFLVFLRSQQSPPGDDA
jgi:low molecular weight protein-tyrosine phosphatase